MHFEILFQICIIWQFQGPNTAINFLPLIFMAIFFKLCCRKKSYFLFLNMPKIIFLENIQKIAETELLNQKIQCSALIYSEKHDLASNFT